MMKQKYTKPMMSVVLMRHRCRLCATSGWDVLEPGEPNVPAGARELDEWE